MCLPQKTEHVVSSYSHAAAMVRAPNESQSIMEMRRTAATEWNSLSPDPGHESDEIRLGELMGISVLVGESRISDDQQVV